MIRATTLLTIVSLAQSAAAEPKVHLPLEGYCRVGRCMPVRIESRQPIVIAGEGLVPTHFAGGAGVVPLLVLGPLPNVVRVGDHELRLRPLGPNERLIGLSSAHHGPAPRLFEQQTPVTVQLDPSHPLPGLPIAWETLDAVILDDTPTSSQIAALLAAGTVVAVRSTDLPDTVWPWQRVGEHWVLRPRLRGPTDALGGEVAYLPAQSWRPAPGAALRRQIFLAGVIVALLVLAATLLHARRRTIAVCGTAIACAIAIQIWRGSLPAIDRAGGQIVVANDPLTQLDRWDYLASSSAVASSLQSQGVRRPVVLDTAHARKLVLTLRCRPDGSVSFGCRLDGTSRLALLERWVEPAGYSPRVQPTVRSPLHEMARQAYLRGGDRIAGEFFTGADDWPAVLIETAAMSR